VADGQASDFLPVAYSVIEPDSVAAVLADAYRWGPHVQAQLLWHGVNDTYLVISSSGKQVVRVYRAGWRSPDEIIYELELLSHLSARGVAVAAPSRTRDDRLVHMLPAPEGERQVAVFAYVEGRPMSWANRRHSFLAGRLAAEVHRGSDNFTSRRHRPPLDLDQLIDQPLAAVNPFLSHRPGDAEALAHCAAQLRTRADQAIRGGLEWGVCHGDFGASNIHIIDGRSASVFDFDLCGAGWRAWDFVAAWAMTHHERCPEIWESFVRGYTEIRPINASDLAAVPLFHAMSRLWSLGAHAQNAGYRGSWRLSDSFLDTYITFLRRWLEGVLDVDLRYLEPIS